MSTALQWLTLIGLAVGLIIYVLRLGGRGKQADIDHDCIQETKKDQKELQVEVSNGLQSIKLDIRGLTDSITDLRNNGSTPIKAIQISTAKLEATSATTKDAVDDLKEEHKAVKLELQQFREKVLSPCTLHSTVENRLQKLEDAQGNVKEEVEKHERKIGEFQITLSRVRVDDK